MVIQFGFLRTLSSVSNDLLKDVKHSTAQRKGQLNKVEIIHNELE